MSGLPFCATAGVESVSTAANPFLDLPDQLTAVAAHATPDKPRLLGRRIVRQRLPLRIACAPRDHLDEHRYQGYRFLGRIEKVAALILRVGRPRDEPVGRELVESPAEDVCSNALVGCEELAVRVLSPEDDVAQDHERPLITECLDRKIYRTV